MRRTKWIMLGALAITACGRDATAPFGASEPAPSVTGNAGAGALYVASNDAARNAVLAFQRMADGSLVPAGSFSTGGVGTGGGLGNQGGVVFAQNSRYLLVVNAASNDVSIFLVRADGSLELTDRAASGGTTPISIATAGPLVYVLNAGGAGNIVGFTLNKGKLTMLPGSSRPLGSSAAGPAQVSFSPNGRWLVVTEKNTNSISTYRVQSNGLTSGPTVNPSNGATPFGFAFTSQGLLVVSEAFGGAPDASAASSYEVTNAGSLATRSASVGTTETAACWVAITPDSRFAYTTNTGSGSITGYAIGGGRLTLLNSDGVTGFIGAGSSPIDLGVSEDGAFTYSLNGGAHTVTGFAIAGSGALAAVSSATMSVPVGANGLAVR